MQHKFQLNISPFSPALESSCLLFVVGRAGKKRATTPNGHEVFRSRIPDDDDLHNEAFHVAISATYIYANLIQ